ncbi:penicillin-binding protein 1A [Desulfonispora thiosulfatigenes DSM 11270]|uniref:Penicillin-binding protein 1A n=1 Tax=Desulfonispora thiosulfatigenes DSM 11270 TaxID=656914 RepID=A0A1W1VRH3_DESTI|nr:PBP1A family penicillin-binding protein [Desulfonispora thiosulfatigenes]SMB95959.1 penicillin-binding protein 1A [Desulfonispora thiosulfatigenes DSM 11270]
MRKNKSKKLNNYKTILIVLLVLAFIVGGAGIGFVVAALKNVPSIDSSNIEAFAVSSSIYDKDEKLVDKLHGVENRDPVKLEDISPNMVNALLAIEDQRFYKHIGIDPFRIAGAAVANIKKGHTAQGGSTLTQQLVKVSMLDPKDKTLKRKIQEAVISLKVENDYTKDEIINFYLNTVYFGDGAYGVEAAAKNFFAKNAKDLTIDEAALLAGVIQNPYKHSPLYHPENAKTRRDIVLNAMVDFNKLSQEEANKLKEKPIKIAEKKKSKDKSYAYQSFIDHVVESAIDNLDIADDSSKLYTGGYKIYTTLDTDIQSNMEDVYANSKNFPSSKKGSLIQSAMVVLDPKTGEIKGLMGGREQTGRRNFNRATQALRQPGSVFKPLAVYAPALEKGYNPATVIDDFPQAYKSSSGTKVFENYDHRYRGLISMRTALQYSINTAAVKMLQQIGVEEGYKFAKKAGISSLVSSGSRNDMGLSLALGGLTKGASPLEITSAYGVFANGGVYVPPHCITRIEDSKGNVIWENKSKKEIVMSPESAYLINDMLQTVVTSGTGRNASIPGRQVAGKTGTTSFNVDVWFVGYTPDLVSSVWMGYDKNDNMSRVSGGGNCAPIWKKVMEKAHKDLPTSKFTRPSNIISTSIDTKSGMRPSNLTPNEFIKSELFNRKFVPKETSKVWVMASVCPDSSQLITDNCPDAVDKVFLKREKPWSTSGFSGKLKGIAPEDAKLEVPKQKCLIHGEGGPKIRLHGGLIDNESAVKLSWSYSKATENTKFQIYRSSERNFIPSSQTFLDSSSELEFLDKSIKKGEKYYYRVIAIDTETDLQSPASNEVEISGTNSNNTEQPGNNVSLKAPKLRYQIKDQTQVRLSWNKPGSGNQITYFVFKSESPGFSAGIDTQIGKGSIISNTSFTDTSVESGKTYYYKVIGQDANSNQSPLSNEIKVTIRNNSDNDEAEDGDD